MTQRAHRLRSGSSVTRGTQCVHATHLRSRWVRGGRGGWRRPRGCTDFCAPTRHQRERRGKWRRSYMKGRWQCGMTEDSASGASKTVDYRAVGPRAAGHRLDEQLPPTPLIAARAASRRSSSWLDHAAVVAYGDGQAGFRGCLRCCLRGLMGVLVFPVRPPLRSSTNHAKTSSCKVRSCVAPFLTSPDRRGRQIRGVLGGMSPAAQGQ